MIWNLRPEAFIAISIKSWWRHRWCSVIHTQCRSSYLCVKCWVKVAQLSSVLYIIELKTTVALASAERCHFFQNFHASPKSWCLEFGVSLQLHEKFNDASELTESEIIGCNLIGLRHRHRSLMSPISNQKSPIQWSIVSLTLSALVAYLHRCLEFDHSWPKSK